MRTLRRILCWAIGHKAHRCGKLYSRPSGRGYEIIACIRCGGMFYEEIARPV